MSEKSFSGLEGSQKYDNSTDKDKDKDKENDKDGKKEEGKAEDKKKKWRGPITIFLEKRKRKQIEAERILLLREERMMEDLERYLMEIEDRHSWSVLQLNQLNYRRIVKREQLARVERKLKEKERKEQEENMKEDGLFYSHGIVQSYKRWQFSPAKHIDFEGHKGAVVSCKLSSSLSYALTCSEDYTLKIWSMANGECLKTLIGHSRVVNDGDFHPNFVMFSQTVSIVSCSGDCTLKLWNSSDTNPVSTSYGHSQAVYRCRFSPDGNTILSCSEDKTIRCWAYPEGYNLYVYRAHTSPVVSICFSSSGRFFVSGSDYGERKILLWDAKLPHFHDPVRISHVIHWTTEGLIKRILLKNGVPKAGFWLSQSQLGLIKNDNDLDIWYGELSDDDPSFSEDEKDSDEEDDEDEKKKKKIDEDYAVGDRKDYKGVHLQVTNIASTGDRQVATEYNPGGKLIISLKHIERPVKDAFVSATIKETRTDIFSVSSGTKIGSFNPEAPVPWLPTVTHLDEKGKPIQKREWSPAFAQSKDNHSIIYHGTGVKLKKSKPKKSVKINVDKEKDDEKKDENEGEDLHNDEDHAESQELDEEFFKEEKDEESADCFDIVWNCPTEPEKGTVMIVVNFCFTDTPTEWHQLSYSLRESAVRMVQGSGGIATSDADKADNKYHFDQAERHRMFWQFIRDKEWKSAASFVDKKAIAYLNDEEVHRRFRVLNLLVDLFDQASWMVLYSPFVFKPGVTKSLLISDTNFDFGEEEPEEIPPPPPPPPVEDDDVKSPENLASPRDEMDGSIEHEEIVQDSLELQENAALLEEKPVDPVEDPNANPKIQSAEDNAKTMLDIMPKSRPMTQDLGLPMIFFLGELDDRIISRDIKQLTRNLTYKIISLESSNLDIAFEIGLTYFPPAYLSVLHKFFANVGQNYAFEGKGNKKKRDKDIFKLLLRPTTTISTKSEEQKAHGNSGKDMTWEEEMYNNLLEDLNKLQKDNYLDRQPKKKTIVSDGSELNHLIKSGKFGPEIEEFSMPLPNNFPNRAGLAKYALNDNILIYDKVLQRMKVTSLPKTLEEVYVPTYSERFQTFYDAVTKKKERIYKKNLLALIKEFMKLQYFKDNSYFLRRRKTYLQLPGLGNHYPNPNYPVPAVILPENEFAIPKKSIYAGKLYGKDVLKSVIVPAVGRKPSPEQMIEIQNNFFKNKITSLNNPLIIPNHRPDYKTDHLDNLVKHHHLTEIQQVKKKGFFSFFFFSRPKAVINPINSSAGNSNSTSGYALLGATPSEKMDVDGISSKTVDAISTKSKKPDPAKTTAPTTAAAGGKGGAAVAGGTSQKKKKKKKKKQVKEIRMETFNTQGAFMGRRSFYPVLPGLESFIATEFPAHKEGSDGEYDADGHHNANMNHEGLIRRFRNNGFELAHHGAVNDVAFSPSENRIATAGGDGFIKVWDPRDGTYVYRLAGHNGAVLSLQYTSTEQFLVSAGSDASIFIWSLLTKSVQRILRGHIDLIYRLSISPDCGVILTASNDGTAKSWATTPRHPDPPRPPKVLTVTDTTALISWSAPPCFNCDVTAFHYQYRVGHRGEWIPPENGQSLAPHLRNRVIEGLIPATHYQFRVRAENRMGKGDWSGPSLLVRTNYGLPETPEKPLICQVTTTTMIIGWFSENPHTFGSASTSFEIQYSGHGETFETCPVRTFTLEECIATGRKVLHYLDKIKSRYERTKDALIKSHGFLLTNRQSEEEKREFPISIELSLDTILNIIERSATDETMVFIGINYTGLQPGFQYIFRVKGLNIAGQGEWSEPTLTINAMATTPHPPSRPRLVASTLRSLTFQWDPPHDDGGSAITGYRLYLQNLDKTIELPRSSIKYVWDGLFPGRSYYCKVLAKNTVGESEYSDLNELKDSFTQIAPPEKPRNPLAVSATWNTITYEIFLPYHNGSQIIKMEIEKRDIRPFHIGEWQNYENVMSNKLNSIFQSENKFIYELKRLYHPSQNIDKINEKNIEFELLELVDLGKQQDDMEKKVRELEILKAKSSMNLASKGKKGNQLGNEIEKLINEQKPFGSKIRFVVNNLLPDTMYEVRACFWNSAGKGEFSHPSHRAKTTKASLPEMCESPLIQSVGMNYVILQLEIPEEGGAPIRHFHIESMDLDTNATQNFTLTRNEYDIQVAKENKSKGIKVPEERLSYRVEGLKVGGSYVFRVRGESDVGSGPFSVWSLEVNLLSEETDVLPQHKK